MPHPQRRHCIGPVDLVKFDPRGESAIPHLFPHSRSFGLPLTRDFDLRGGAMAVNRRDTKIGFDPVFLTTGERENVSARVGRKRNVSWTKMYFTDTDQSDCNIISKDNLPSSHETTIRNKLTGSCAKAHPYI
jgi:hypothetical protein